ncbi:hypothetical protein PV413_03515 [Streptomyces scabiei]|uniref:hypothetical protein n=1 Tax=Streptomyces scabiei TaxID=1930 RepID=UPI0013C4A542|nr:MULTISPECIES: hypothetical protein [Streptomyces]MDX2749590.1 hypothetical protein [Streptomyces scabiei]MDX3026776.1 hypothetical protein [Streptomyces scabiei]MDX3146542.1 hypothetical protein [Streptomyces scabiei]MDX3196948.1 hypothetical protein [Streptomyces scabiei]MDX3210054.1 hypothetical protein [Streptomyces scabiei]
MATLHIACRTTPHTPPVSLRDRWDAYFQRVHSALPLDAPDRHALDQPAVETAFARLAIDHPDTVTPADGGAS